MSDIFLSYNREDKAVARRFATAFEAEGFSVWWDTTLRTGEAYDEVTESALRASGTVVVLWSPRSVVSRWVRAEVTLANRLGRLTPVTIEACERPIMFELIHTAELAGWTGGRQDPRWRALVEDVRRSINSAKTEPDQSPSPPPALAVAPWLDRRLALTGLAGALVLGGAGTFAWFRSRGTGAPAAGAASVAVLPFANLDRDPAETYFADGLSAEIRATLSRNSLLTVAAQTSSAAFRDADDNAVQIAAKLGVAFLLDGNARKIADVVRVNAELVDGRTGFTRWSRSFDRPLTDIFAVQSEIADAVSQALAAQVSSAAAGRPGKSREIRSPGGTLNVSAFEHFLRGRELLQMSRSAETDQQALGEFDTAIAADPAYAAAYAQRAFALAVIASQSATPGEGQSPLNDALAAARRAMALAPDFSGGPLALAYTLFNLKLDVRGARQPFEQARRLGGGDAAVLSGFAIYCARIGRHGQAREDIDQALTIDPLNANTFRTAGTIRAAARTYEASLPFYDKALAFNPGMSVVNALKGTSFWFLGRIREAREAFAREPNTLFGLPGLAIIDRKHGQAPEAESALKRLVKDYGDSGLYQQAQVLAQWGRVKEALDTLERARSVGDAGMILINTDPFLDPLRRNPQFRLLLREIGFE